jgi:hypothetical protein
MSNDPDTFVAGHPPPIRDIVDALRTVIRENMPDATEIVYHEALGYTLTSGSRGRILYVAPMAGYVNLGFMFGGHLDDPEGLLIGDGARLRHIKVRSVDDARNPRLAKLVRAAADDGPASLAKLDEQLKRRTRS